MQKIFYIIQQIYITNKNKDYQMKEKELQIMSPSTALNSLESDLIYYKSRHLSLPSLQSLNSKYYNGIASGLYPFKKLQPNNQPSDHTKLKFQHQEKVFELKEKLKKIGEQIDLQREKKQKLAQSVKQQQENRVFEAKLFVSKIRSERLEQKKYRKFFEVQRDLRKMVEDAIRERQNNRRIEKRKEEKRLEIVKRINQMKSNKQQTQKSPPRQNNHRQKRLHERIQQRFQQEKRKQQQRLKRQLLLKKNKKKIDWQKIQDHSRDYQKAVQHYELHKPYNEQLNSKQQFSLLKSKVRLPKIKYEPPISTTTISHVKKVLQQVGIHTTQSKISKQSTKDLGNKYLLQSLTKINKKTNSPTSQQNSMRQSNDDPSKINYIPEIERKIKVSIRKLTNKLFSEATQQNKSLDKLIKFTQKADQLANKVQLIGKLEKTKQPLRQQQLNQENQLLNLYLYSIKNKLRILQTTN